MRKSTTAQTPAQKYHAFIEGVRADARETHTMLRNDERALRAIIDLRASCIRECGAYDKLKGSIAQLKANHAALTQCATLHASYLPLVKSGLMSVAECVREVSLGHCARPPKSSIT